MPTEEFAYEAKNDLTIKPMQVRVFIDEIELLVGVSEGGTHVGYFYMDLEVRSATGNPGTWYISRIIGYGGFGASSSNYIVITSKSASIYSSTQARGTFSFSTYVGGVYKNSYSGLVVQFNI